MKRFSNEVTTDNGKQTESSCKVTEAWSSLNSSKLYNFSTILWVRLIFFSSTQKKTKKQRGSNRCNLVQREPLSTSVEPVKYSSRLWINVVVVWLPAISVRISRDVWRVLFMCRVTLLFLPHSKSLTGLFTILDKITLHSSYKTDLLLRYLLQGNT